MAWGDSCDLPDDMHELAEQFFRAYATGAASTLAAAADRLALISAESDDARVRFIAEIAVGIAELRSSDPAAAETLGAAVSRYLDGAVPACPLTLLQCLFGLLGLVRPELTRPTAEPLLLSNELSDEHRTIALWIVGLADAWACDLVRGELVLSEAAELAERAGLTLYLGVILGVLARAEAMRGRLTLAQEHLERAISIAGETGSPWVANGCVEVRATLYLAMGDEEAWHGTLRLLVDERQGVESGLLDEYRYELATHLATTGHLAEALDIFTSPDVSHPAWPGASVLPAWRGWIEHPGSADAMHELDLAAHRLVRPAELLLAGRLTWLLGVHYGRMGRRADAIRLLIDAQRAFTAIGAMAFRDATSRRLTDLNHALPSQDRSDEAQHLLTGAEQRVAMAIATGMSNKEAASALFVTVKTIEFHLANIYRKLHLRNRAELARFW